MSVYGTNEGDCWLAPGSPVQERLDADGEGLVLIHEMMVRDGKLQECLYVTSNSELIEEATRGHELYLQAASERLDLHVAPMSLDSAVRWGSMN